MFGFLRRRHEDKLHWRTDRTQILYCLPESPHEYLDPLSRREVVRRTEWLMEKFGLVKEGGMGIARHTIGTGLTLQLNSDDPDFNRDGEAQFLLYSLTPARFDLAKRRDFYASQRTSVQQLVFRGEFFSRATQNPRWDNAPCEQLYDTLEIESPDNLEQETRKIYDGVRLGENFEPLGYYARKAGGGHAYVPEEEMFHWFEPTGINQVRGESAFSPVVDKLVDWADLEKLVIATAKTQNALAIAVKKLAKVGGRGAFGGIKRAAGTETETGVDTRALEKAFPGLVSYLGQDGEAQLISHNSPNDKLEPFLSNLIGPDVFLALGVPHDFFWPGKTSGQDRRFSLQRADLRFKVLADDLIYQWCNGVAYRFLSHRIERGLIKRPTDPHWAEKMGWQQPARITVDNGRDGKLELDQLANGGENLRSMWDRRGRNYREEAIKQWLREWSEFLQEHERMKKLMPAELHAIWDMVPQKWRAGMPGAGGASIESEPVRKDEETSGADLEEEEEEAAA